MGQCGQIYQFQSNSCSCKASNINREAYTPTNTYTSSYIAGAVMNVHSNKLISDTQLCAFLQHLCKYYVRQNETLLLAVCIDHSVHVHLNRQVNGKWNMKVVYRPKICWLQTNVGLTHASIATMGTHSICKSISLKTFRKPFLLGKCLTDFKCMQRQLMAETKFFTVLMTFSWLLIQMGQCLFS